MNQGKFQALADRLGQRREKNLRERRPMPHYEPIFRDFDVEEVRPSKQLSLTFEELNPVLEVYQRFDSRAREIEWSVYGGNGEFLLQFGCRLDGGVYEIHSIHPELLQSREEMRGYLEELNRRLATLYPALELLQDRDGKPLLQKRG
ncbi:MAG TPA: hypothetical protein VJR29_09320 [bacterium]|nr:hypothetical protein [bacterium]